MTTATASRLDALRRELARRNLDGLVIPRSDEYMNEYVPSCAERLAWLTGFTGSAGTSVVTRDKAALFVDGRYTLQAREEVDDSLFEIVRSTTRHPWEWVQEHLLDQARLGYDPWLHTPNQAARYRAACDRVDGRLVAVESNPIDAVWLDRPAPPREPVVPYPAVLAGADSATKRAQVAQDLDRERLDAAVLASPASVAWLLNVRGNDVPYTPLPLAFAIIDRQGRVDLFVDPRKAGPGLAEHLGDEVRLLDPDRLGPALDALGRAKSAVGVDGEATPAWIADRLRVAGARVARATDPCALPRARKTAAEIDGMRAAHRRDGAAMARFLQWLAVTPPDGALTERTAADRLEAFRAPGENFRGLSFPTIAGAGPNGAIVHYRVTARSDRRLDPGSLFLVDSGAQYLDGTTDVTRTVAIGQPTDEMRDRFTRVLKGHIALATALFPTGTSGPQLDVLARRALWEAGLDYDHGTGHGVGCYLGVHEGPQRIGTTGGRVALEPGMIVSNEPGYYKEGAFGIRIENLIHVVAAPSPEGAERELLTFETLTLVPIDLSLVEPALLDETERTWLNAYHARVRDELGPLLDESERSWLNEATREIPSRR